MPTFIRDIDEQRFVSLSPQAVDKIHLLLGDWQVLADLSQSDLLLWLPDITGGFTCAAHCRPATGPTIHLEDVVGLSLPKIRQELVERVMQSGQVTVNPVRRWTGMNTVSETLIPLLDGDCPIGVVARESNLAFAVGEIGGEGWFSDVSDKICHMMAHGDFPFDVTPTGGKRGMPRVMDGAVLLDGEGRVLHASPNAISAFKRLGIKRHLIGSVLAEEITLLVETHSTVDETLAVVVMGRASWMTEVEAHAVVLTLRALPLKENGSRCGAVLLCRDVTEKRAHEMELISKDATIREIHHRVKNNLQTASALLRLQARRSDSEPVKKALGEAQRRLATISTVHEVLSQTAQESVDFDEVFSRLLGLAATAASSEKPISTSFIGSFGKLGTESASTLGVVINELVTNAVEHGLADTGGKITVEADRKSDDELEIRVMDDGVGIPDGQFSSGLGTQIVTTLVRSELGGTIEWHRADPPEHGTIVEMTATRL